VFDDKGKKKDSLHKHNRKYKLENHDQIERGGKCLQKSKYKGKLGPS
jgi:hypothetical protein